LFEIFRTHYYKEKTKKNKTEKTGNSTHKRRNMHKIVVDNHTVEDQLDNLGVKCEMPL
jgi:hypothetical protein